MPHIYAVGDCAGYWQLAHTAFREGEVAAENACGHDAVVDNRAVPRPIYTDPEIAGVGLTEAEAREQYGDDVAVGTFPWVANARAVMQNETTGWVKSIHETRYGELLGLVMVGPHVTDLIEAGVVAIDAESTVETVADGMAPHPTLVRGDQGGRPRRARPRDPPPEPQAAGRRARLGCPRPGGGGASWRRARFSASAGGPRQLVSTWSSAVARDPLRQPAGRGVLDEAEQVVPAEERALDPRHRQLGARVQQHAVAGMHVGGRPAAPTSAPGSRGGGPRSRRRARGRRASTSGGSGATDLPSGAIEELLEVPPHVAGLALGVGGLGQLARRAGAGLGPLTSTFSVIGKVTP